MQEVDSPLRQGGIAFLRERALWAVLGSAAVLHGILAAWSLQQPENYLQGDRAINRVARIERLLEADGMLALLAELGGPGDYVFHAILWGAGGATLVVVSQVVLFLGSLVALYWLGRAISIPPWPMATATAAYVLLPSNIHQPHTLVSEAFFTPLVLIGFCFLARCLILGRNSPMDIAGFGLCAGLASFIRPLFLPLPALLALFVLSNPDRRWRSFVMANALALLLPVAWSVAQYQQVGHVELGGRGSGLQDNLFERMNRVAAQGGQPLDVVLRERRRADLGTFLGYAVENPGPVAATFAVDAVHLTLNTGANHVGGRFFGWFEMTRDTLYWRRVHDEKGLAGLVGELLQREATMILVNVVALLAWLGFLGLGVVGVLALLRSPHRRVTFCMLTLVLGVALASQSASAVRFGLRSPFEFVLAVFFAAGLAELVRTGSLRWGFVGRSSAGVPDPRLS